MVSTVDVRALEAKVRAMYRQVALEPSAAFHFETGRGLAERLGYDPLLLDQVPAAAVESFAGVGHVFALAGLRVGETVVDLGSGSGLDAFVAAEQVGGDGTVIGVDFTPAQLDKARGLAAQARIDHVRFVEGRIEDLPVPDESAHCVISNGVINLCPDKGRVFAEAARVLRHGGRLAIADIVTERPLADAIVADADLWASCIGGAAPEDHYRLLIEAAGLTVREVRRNPYEFLSESARGASVTYGVKSISLLATKPF